MLLGVIEAGFGAGCSCGIFVGLTDVEAGGVDAALI